MNWRRNILIIFTVCCLGLLTGAPVFAASPYDDYYDNGYEPEAATSVPTDNDSYYTAPGGYTDNDSYYSAPGTYQPNKSKSSCSSIGDSPSCLGD